MKKLLFILIVIGANFSACENNTSVKKMDSSASTSTVDTLCFEFKLKKDVTSCQLIINGDKISGYYDWSPFEKDGGHGILQNGVRNGDTITVDWKMMIEGAVQTEQLFFTLTDDKLNQLEGELIEEGDKVVLKDPSKAKISGILAKVPCAQIAKGIEIAKSAVDMMK